MASMLEDHPQRAEIERAILSGSSVRAITEWCKPRVSHVTVSKFRARLLRPAMQAKAKTMAKQALAFARRADAELTQEQFTQLSDRANLIEPFIQRLNGKYKRYDTLLADAVKGQVVLKDGNPVELSPDIRAVAALDQAETRAMDLHARIAGLLQQDQPSVTQVNVALVMPSTSQADRPALASGTTIDVEPE